MVVSVDQSGTVIAFFNFGKGAGTFIFSDDNDMNTITTAIKAINLFFIFKYYLSTGNSMPPILMFK